MVIHCNIETFTQEHTHINSFSICLDFVVVHLSYNLWWCWKARRPAVVSWRNFLLLVSLLDMFLHKEYKITYCGLFVSALFHLSYRTFWRSCKSFIQMILRTSYLLFFLFLPVPYISYIAPYLREDVPSVSISSNFNTWGFYLWRYRTSVDKLSI